MIAVIFSLLCIVATVSAVVFGNTSLLSDAILNGAQQAVTLSIGLLGSMCLWCGILQVLRKAGLTAWLARTLSGILSRIFPTAWRTGNGKEEIAASIAANLLGIGNAATPLALCAMQKMKQDQKDPAVASDDMVTFTVLNTAPLTLLPTTLIALRSAAGSKNAIEILPAVWICSLVCACVAVLLSRALRRLWKR